MKFNKLFTLLFLITASILSAQTSFSNGFEEGYKKGYCHDQGMSCMEPIAPISPIPNNSESSDNYNDGYNRGFKMGVAKSKTNADDRSNAKYKTTKPTFIDYSGKDTHIDNTDYSAVANKIAVGMSKERIENGDYKGAIHIGLAAVKNFPNATEFMLFLGQAYEGLNNNSSAIKWYSEYLKYYPDNEKIKRTVSKLQGKSDIRDNTTPKYKSSSSDKKKEVYSLFKSKKFRPAISLIDEEIENSGDNSLIGIRGLAYYFLDNYSKAISDITKSAKNTNEIKSQLLFHRAMAKSAIGDYLGAISDYDVLIKRNEQGSMATLYNNKAYAYVNLKKYKKALPLVTEALKLDKNQYYIWDTRAEIYLKTGEYLLAKIDANKAISLQENENSFYIRGLAQIKLLYKDKGCKDLSRAGELGKSEAYEEIKTYCN